MNLTTARKLKLFLLVSLFMLILGIGFTKPKRVEAATCWVETASSCCSTCGTARNGVRECCENGNCTAWEWSGCLTTSHPSCACSGDEGGSCTNGATGGCGTNGCGSTQTSVCVNGSWSCTVSGSCSYVPGCGYNPSSPSGCAVEGQWTPYPPGTCSGGSNNGGTCLYDSGCPGGTCYIPNQNRCCDGLVWNYPYSGTCVCPTCNPTSPSPISLVSPGNNSVNMPNTVTLDWTNTASWGTGCPQSNNYILRYAVKTGASCPAAGAAYAAIATGTASTRTLTNLAWGTTYCWYAQVSNGTNSSNSVIWQFTTAKAPTITNYGIVSGLACGTNISGSSHIEGTDNPITFFSEFNLSDGVIGAEELKIVSIYIVPTDVRNAAVIAEDTAATTEAYRYFMARAWINFNNPSQSQFAIINANTAPYWSGGYSSGNLSNVSGAGTLMNLNGSDPNNTHVEKVNANTIRVYWQIRFDDNFKFRVNGANYASVINNNIYSAAFREYAPGQWNSSSGSTTVDRALQRLIQWGVNVQPPVVTISDPIVLNSTAFRVNWGLTGYGLTVGEGYMWTKSGDLTINRTYPNAKVLNLTSAEPADFSPSNIFVGIGTGKTLNRQDYTIPAGTNPDDIINTKMAANDSACNRVVDTGGSLDLNDAWIMTVGGNAHANNFDFNVKAAQFTNFTGYNSLSYLSTYISSVFQSALKVTQRTSMKHFVLEGYEDWNKSPIKSSPDKNWYDYIHTLVAKNSTIRQINATQMTAGQRTSQLILATTGETMTNTNYTRHLLINNDFVLRTNTSCDTRSIIFINGKLTIEPRFIVRDRLVGTLNVPMGCMFVVNGDIEVLNGTFYNDYDILGGFFITNGKFITSEDNGGSPSTARYEGIFVSGSVIANEGVFNRNLRMLNNSTQPAEFFVYDPRYSNIFKNELTVKDFSIREKGYMDNL